MHHLVGIATKPHETTRYGGRGTGNGEKRVLSHWAETRPVVSTSEARGAVANHFHHHYHRPYHHHYHLARREQNVAGREKRIANGALALAKRKDKRDGRTRQGRAGHGGQPSPRHKQNTRKRPSRMHVG